MSVREYVGARYVPLFAEPLTWDATRTYEPLTVVLYQGNSYTSRQAVPANIDITNTTYWAQTGNYNAQVEQYRAEVQTFNGRITTIEGDIPTSAFDSTNTVKKYVDDNVASLDSDIYSLESIIPAANFDSTNTVKKYVDDNISELSYIIPSTNFDSTNTVKKYVDDSVSTLDSAIENVARKIQVSVLDYGAVGDGVTDDTQAFQSALDSGNDVYIPVDRGETYLISGTLYVRDSYVQINSAPDSRITEANDHVGILFMPPASNTECFNVSGHGVRFNSVCIHTDVNETHKGIGIRAEHTSAEDIDIFVTNCEFYNLETALHVIGRGLRCQGDSFVTCENGIFKGQKPNTSISQCRAFQVYNCRFHSLTGIGIKIIDIENGCIIDGNMNDLASLSTFTFLDANEMYNCVVSNNTCVGVIKVAYSRGNVFANNTFRFTVNRPDNTVDSAITFNGVTLGTAVNACVVLADVAWLCAIVRINRTSSYSAISMCISGCVLHNTNANPSLGEYACVIVETTFASVHSLAVSGFSAFAEHSGTVIKKIGNFSANNFVVAGKGCGWTDITS